jgi:hypothetical protein
VTVEQSFETMWRMAKLADGIDTTVRLIETVIETLPTLKFRSTAWKEIPIRELAGLARSAQAGTSVPRGHRLISATCSSSKISLQQSCIENHQRAHFTGCLRILAKRFSSRRSAATG